ncbi:SAP domain protein, putative [Paecilomyces variotii No. 5]|uniref:SAP domain protein, putative n=1 Tax=Byssochlamys spectabilis (strain No. 5 / NBRC 109023) TaxID=1356009 RepID=V5G2C3_BYSSN|nr:SAP domain protein, putative [Paecilomyces variotii No. 5]
MATDYSKKTNAELIDILKSRSLPHTGKKADLIARLQEDDSKPKDAAAAAPAAAPAAKTDNAEDVIDWEDDEVKPSTEAGAAAIAAGGKGEVPNPVAVPNQQLGTDPAKTDDLKVEAKGDAPSTAVTEEKAEKAATAAEEAPAEPEKPAVDYSIGLPSTEVEEELKKRKARAEKFGIIEDSQTALQEAEKAVARAKRFGAAADGDTKIGIKGLDQPLPDEKSRKRGRGDNEQGGRGGKRRDFNGRNRNRRDRRGNGGGNGGNRKNETDAKPVLSEKDRLALEARKKRFATAA